ncbi:hypothetical protein AR158_c650R [Paramecium bursaria Chlorella virus AR158]|uniref:hypothetical protein n=1 Tax=Paramecium bursaria Chlorella virus AR158 TaxID=380598 RepID=UPI00015AA805|nr:hypothetical protein AR158_c650R [Paramecium bursaria Chlorella virus AR158]ABU44195.1 hypothetical protein AR158_c650R [Paramecium bursaria Chlorella virus AR158]
MSLFVYHIYKDVRILIWNCIEKFVYLFRRSKLSCLLYDFFYCYLDYSEFIWKTQQIRSELVDSFNNTNYFVSSNSFRTYHSERIVIYRITTCIIDHSSNA